MSPKEVPKLLMKDSQVEVKCFYLSEQKMNNVMLNLHEETARQWFAHVDVSSTQIQKAVSSLPHSEPLLAEHFCVWLTRHRPCFSPLGLSFRVTRCHAGVFPV